MLLFVLQYFVSPIFQGLDPQIAALCNHKGNGQTLARKCLLIDARGKGKIISYLVLYFFFIFRIAVYLKADAYLFFALIHKLHVAIRNEKNSFRDFERSIFYIPLMLEVEYGKI